MENLLAALIGALIGALVSTVVTWFTLRFNYRQLFAETVSKNRMDWVNVWRENISIFLSCAEMLHNEAFRKQSESDKLFECKKEMLKARAMIITRLNNSEIDHVLMYGALTQLDYSPNSNFYEQQANIIELAQKILKPEWERVKLEAKGKENVQL